MQEATTGRFRYREPVVIDRFSVLRRWIASGSGSSVDRQRQSGIAGFEEHGGLSKDWLGDCVSMRHCKTNARHADSLRDLTTQIAKLIVPSIIRREIKRRGYVPIFLDGTAIEVKGKNFEGAGKIYTGDKAFRLHSANVIESLNALVRRAVKVRGHFTSVDAAKKLIFLALREAKKKWGSPIQCRDQARREFAIYFCERFGASCGYVSSRGSSEALKGDAK